MHRTNRRGSAVGRARRAAYRAIDEAVEERSLKKLRYAEYAVARAPLTPEELADLRSEIRRAETLIRRR